MSDIEEDDDDDFYQILFESDSDDSDVELFVRGGIRTKNENYLESTVPNYDDETFFEHFRVSVEVAENIGARYSESSFYKGGAGLFGVIPPFHQVLIFLWYIGHETSSFRDVADRFDITISTLFKVIRKVGMFLSSLAPEYIKWPDDTEKVNIERQFRDHSKGFPNIIGAIDGCHILIDKPEEDPDSYRDRKKNFSIQMQAVCDHEMRIRDVFIGYPGSAHDSRVFRTSPFGQNLAEKCGQYYILGDSGYPLMTHLLTPYKDLGNLTDRQIKFNKLLSSNRVVIEHCFGLLKQKFRQLYHVKLRSIRFIVHFIRAACVLHNIALYDEFLLQEDEEDNSDNDENLLDNQDDDEDLDGDENAKQIRDRICNSF